MKIFIEMGIEKFEAWSGAIDTKNTIIEHDLCDEFDSLIDELYPNGLTDTELNDLLWHDSNWVYNLLEINEDEDEE